MSTPNSTVVLFKNTNLRDSDGDYNTVYFSSAAKFKTWLMEGSGNPLTAPRYCKEFTNQMYKKEGEGVLKVSATMQELNGVDYMYYTNTGYENITYFCFVDRVEYVNDATVAIHYHEDSWQTWIRVLNVKRGICDRKIVPVASDTMFSELNDVPDYTANAELRVYNTMDIVHIATEGKWLVVATNVPVNPTSFSPANITQRFGINTGVADCITYYVIRANSTDINNLNWLRNLVLNARTGGVTQSGYDILQVYMTAISCIPSYIINNCDSDNKVGCIGALLPDASTSYVIDNITYTFYQTGYEESVTGMPAQISRTALSRGIFGGYVPKNKKMYSAPYCSYRLKNNWGNYYDLNPAHIDWVNDTAKFTVNSSLTVGNTPSCYVDYEGIERNTNTRVSGSPFDNVPYSTDTFNQWLSQNKISVGLNLAKGALGAAALLTGLPAGAVMGVSTATAAGFAGAHSLVGLMQEMQQATAKGPSIAGDISSSSPRNEELDHFSIDTLSVPYDIAKNIDDMFSMYGYKHGFMDKFEWQGILNGRQFWTYYKTVDAHVKETNSLDPVPAYAKARIEQLLNNGVRIWRRDYIFDYEEDNTVTPTPAIFDD